EWDLSYQFAGKKGRSIEQICGAALEHFVRKRAKISVECSQPCDGLPRSFNELTPWSSYNRNPRHRKNPNLNLSRKAIYHSVVALSILFLDPLVVFTIPKSSTESPSSRF